MPSSSAYTNDSPYDYTPSLAWSIVFITLFSLSAITHSIQAWRAKYWVVYPTLLLGAITEIIGWSGRAWSSQNVLRLDPFLMQITTYVRPGLNEEIQLITSIG
jgi:hypothetical protein